MADIEISSAHNNYRLLGSLAHLDLGAGNASLKLYGGVQPAPGVAATSPLATVGLTKPAGSIVSNALALTAASAFVLASGSGAVTWGRLENGNGDWNSDLAAGATGSGKPVQLDDVLLFAGGKVAPTTMLVG